MGVAVGFLAGLLVVFVMMCMRRRCQLKYRARGEDMGVNFSDVSTISSYIPQINSPMFAQPLVACSVTNLDKNLFDWSDPDRSYVYYDLTKDAEYLLQGLDIMESISFSQVSYWPPPKHEKLEL